MVRILIRGPIQLSTFVAEFLSLSAVINVIRSFQVWVTFQDNVLHYLSNTLLLPLVIRSNRTISR